MKYQSWSEREKYLLEKISYFEQHDPPGYLAIIAVWLSRLNEDGSIYNDDSAIYFHGCTRGDAKRAIKRLRIFQSKYSEHAVRCEDAITFIRREWLHRKAAAQERNTCV